MTERRLAFLCSGGGGNLEFVRRCLAADLLPRWRLSGVVADRDCGALAAAREAGVAGRRVSYERGRSDALVGALRDLGADLVVLAFDRILDETVVDAFEGRLVNLHYALLPSFGGLTGTAPVRRALDAGSRVLGTTVHVVTRDVDAGPILGQSALGAGRREGFERTMDRVFRSGAVNLAGVLARWGEDGPTDGPGSWAWREDVGALFSPAVSLPDGAFGDAFWRTPA